jgi:hypothetical protein
MTEREQLLQDARQAQYESAIARNETILGQAQYDARVFARITGTILKAFGNTQSKGARQ